MKEIEKKPIEKSEKTFHIGLMGHIDAGKTMVASRLTEVISTAGLDKHDQAKRRGITIDMGFTFFRLKNHLVTIVDAPGHSDLIQSVISCANIIDLGVLVVDATKGVQVQTGEHLIILNSLDIPYLFILINKIDIASPMQVEKTKKELQRVIKGTSFENNYEIFSVSAKEDKGFELVRQNLLEYIVSHPPQRDVDKEFNYLIDHHFVKKGFGTIFTGTVLSGRVQKGDVVRLLPQNIEGQIKSIQKAKKSVEGAKAGDRCGIAVSKLKKADIHRGSLLTDHKDAFTKSQILEVEIHEDPHFKPLCKFGQQITINHYMRDINARIFPYTLIDVQGKQYKVKYSPKKDVKTYHAYLWLEEFEYFKRQDKLLLSRLDLDPSSLRIMGVGTILKFQDPPLKLHKVREKTGRVQNPTYTQNSVIAESLVESKKGGKAIEGLRAEPPFGMIKGSFGQGGKVEVEVSEDLPEEKRNQIKKGDEIILRIIREFEIKPNTSYK